MTSIPMHIIEPLVDRSPGLQDRPRLRQQAEEKDYLFLPALPSTGSPIRSSRRYYRWPSNTDC